MLEQYREQIDKIDEELLELFSKRMDIAAKIAETKDEDNRSYLNSKNRRAKIKSVVDKSDEDKRDYNRILFEEVLSVSRSYQSSKVKPDCEIVKNIKNVLESSEKVLPDYATVACQGTEGAYSQIACEKVFRNPNIVFFSNFESVFTAVEKGLCQYGVVPLENSTAGSVNAVYDLMIKHRFSIVRSTRIKVDHNLLVRPGTKLSDIKTVYSHEQALSQCSDFIGQMGFKAVPVANTAIAAEKVATSDSKDIAALASKNCVDLYGLECLKRSVQNNGNNYTRFIIITKELKILPGADRTSLMAVLPHEPGALYKLLSKFNARGINLIKLESRPLPQSDFEFMFYFDLDASVYSFQFEKLINELEDECDEFYYLGSYSEVI